MRSSAMSGVALRIAILAAALAVTGARAEMGSEDCLRLEAQLAGLDRAGSRAPDPRQLAQAAARQEDELARTQAYAKGIGCGPRFLFAPEPPAQCGPLEQKIKQLQVSIDRTRAQAAQASQGGGVDPRRRELLFALARGQCGPQYRLVERRVEPQRQEKKGFFEMLFGGGRSSEDAGGGETVVEPEMDPAEGGGRVSTYRTVCVRTCDGFFFPISYQTSQNAFKRDEAICQATCPGAEAKLFSYPNPGGKLEMASDVDGQPYTKLENAFRYRKEFVQGCSCKPEGMDWAQALAGVDDKTVKQGDIVVDEKTSHDMSRAKSPEEAQAQARAAAQKRPARPAPTDPSATPQQAYGRPNAPQTSPGQAFPSRAFPEQGDPTGTADGGRIDAPSDDVIILDQPRPNRSRVEGRPLDGPDVQRVPQGY